MKYDDTLGYEIKLLTALQNSKSELNSKTFLNDSEKEIKKILQTLIQGKGIYFSAQTPFSAFIDYGEITEKHIFWNCSRWYVDFLIIENKSEKPFAVIEYFGGGHYKDKNAEVKDNTKKKILQMAKIPLGIIRDSEDKIKTPDGKEKTTEKLDDFLSKVEEYYNNKNGYPNENIVLL